MNDFGNSNDLDAMASNLLGRVIDARYQLDSLLGSGGMGTVYKATRLSIGDMVAIKMLRPDQFQAPQAIERFRREAQAAARLKHPNVVTIHDFGVTSDNLTFLVMELVEGYSLRSLIKRSGPLALSDIAEVISQIASALDEAHRNGIIHRDLKPDNIIVTTLPNGLRVKVLDFGIAKMRDAATGIGTLTQTGMIMGTPHYMSPEQCLGEELDRRSDIYSLGIMLYEMLSGTVPFNAPNSTAIIMQHITKPPPPLNKVSPPISPAIEAVVMQALEKQSAMRPATAGELAHKFYAAINNADKSPPPIIRVNEVNVPPTMPMSSGVAPARTEKQPVFAFQATEKTERVARGDLSELQPRSANKKTSLLLISSVVLLVLAVGVIVGLVLSRRGENNITPLSSTEQPKANNTSKPSNSNDQTSNAPTSSLSALASKKPEDTTSKKEDTTPKKDDTAPKQEDTTPKKIESQGPPSEGTWFVILGSFPKGAPERAAEQLRRIRGQGYEASIINTDNYPNLARGYLSVVMGPYTKPYAANLATRMRSIVPSAYIKSGR